MMHSKNKIFKCEFQIFNQTENEWDNLLVEKNFHYRQLYCWGEYQKTKGNKIIRLILVENNISTPLQIIHRRILNFSFLYIPGGIPKSYLINFNKLINFLKLQFKVKTYYLRTDSNYFDDKDRYLLLEKHLIKSKIKTNNNLSLILNIDKNNNFEKNFTSKWKQNLKRSFKKDINIFFNKDVNYAEFKTIINDFKKNKKLNLTIEINQFIQIIKSSDKKISIVSAYDNKKKLIGFKSFFHHNFDSWDFFTCTNTIGRNNLAGYTLLYNAINYSKNLNIKRYFLGAYDEAKYPGVSYFKKETGAKIFKYEGEWENSNSKMYSYFINFFLLIYFRFRLILF